VAGLAPQWLTLVGAQWFHLLVQASMVTGG